MKIVMDTKAISVRRDPDDDKFLSCAIDAGCQYHVSGDDDLLSLGKVEDVTICTPSEFLNTLRTEENT